MILFRLLRLMYLTLVFNFKYFPFKQALKLPVFVYHAHFLALNGKVQIDSDHVRRGMIRLGCPRAATYPRSGITWRNHGKVIFKGSCNIANDCYVVVGEQATLTLGDDFRMNAGTKLVCNCHITIGNHTRFGWECIIMDTNFHPLYDMDKKRFKKAFGPIVIGDYNWFGTQCYVMHSVTTPERCIFGARSMVTRGGQYESYCLHGGNPIHVLSRNVMRDYDNDQILDYSLPKE